MSKTKTVKSDAEVPGCIQPPRPQQTGYKARYARLRGRIAQWRKRSRLMASVPGPVLMQLVALDDAVATMYEQVLAHPNDLKWWAQYAALEDTLNRRLTLLEGRSAAAKKGD